MSPTSEEARRAFQAGLAASREERWPEAEAAFRRSAGLVRRQSTLYNLALSVYMQGRHRECLSILEDALREDGPASDPEYDEYARRLLLRVRSELARIHLTIVPPTARLRIDGDAAPGSGTERWIAIPPGSHDAEISAPGYVTRRLSIAAQAGLELNQSIALERLPASPRSERPSGGPFATSVAPWIAIGIGGALLAAATVTGVLALEGDSDLKTQCPTEKDCDPALRDERDRVIRLGHVTDALLISGGVVAVGGVAWRLLLPRPRTEEHGQAVVIEASGRF